MSTVCQKVSQTDRKTESAPGRQSDRMTLWPYGRIEGQLKSPLLFLNNFILVDHANIAPPPPLKFLKGDFGLSTIPPSAVLIKMQVSELDLAEFPHSYLRKLHYMLRKLHYMLRKSHYMLQKSHYMLQKSHHILLTVCCGLVFNCWLYGCQFDTKKPDHVACLYVHYAFTS